MMGALSFRTTLLGLASGLGAIAAPSAALAQTSQTFVDLTGSVGYSSNPSLRESSDRAAFGRVSAYGIHSIVGERGQTDLSALVENSTYLGDYGSKQIFDLGARTRYKVSELVSMFGSVQFSGDSGGQLYSRFNDAPIVPDPGTGGVDPLPGQFTDPTLFSLNQRQYRLSGQVGADITLSARDSLAVSGGARRIFFGSNGDEFNYLVVDGSVGWQHKISEITSAGAQISIQRANYSGAQNDTTIISPRLTYRTQIAERWDANVAAGVSLSNRRTESGSSRSVSPSVDGSLCRTTESERYCGTLSHSIQSDVGQNARKTTAVSVDYYNRLSPKDTIQARARIVRYSGDNSITDLSRATYYTGGMSYGRKLSDRLSSGADAGVRKIVQNGGSIPIDLSLSAFLRYRLGDLR